MSKIYHLHSLEVVQSLKVNKDFQPSRKEGGRKILSVLKYNIQCIWYFDVFSKLYEIGYKICRQKIYHQDITLQHEDIAMKSKHILCYLCETTDMGLFFAHGSKSQSIEYANAGYNLYVRPTQSQVSTIMYLIQLYPSYPFSKQSLQFFHIIWKYSQFKKLVKSLFSYVQHIIEKCGICSLRNTSTILYEVACNMQIIGDTPNVPNQINFSQILLYT